MIQITQTIPTTPITPKYINHKQTLIVKNEKMAH